MVLHNTISHCAGVNEMTARPYYEPNSWQRLVHFLQSQRNVMYGFILAVALIGFEIFNYSTTELALGGFAGGVTLCWFSMGNDFGNCLLWN